MIKQIGTGFVIQSNKNSTLRLMNDEEQDMNNEIDTVIESVEKNLEIMFRSDSSKNGSLEVKNFSELDQLPKSNEMSKAECSSSSKDQSRKKKHHDKNSGHVLKKTDKKTANNDKNLTPSKSTEIEQPRNYKSHKETPKRTTNSTISDNERVEMIGKCNEVENEHSALRKKSVHTHSKRKNTAQSRNDTANYTSFKDTLIPSTNGISLSISDNEHDKINNEPSALCKKSVHNPSESIKTVHSRNNMSNGKTLMPMINSIDLTIADDDYDEIPGTCIDINDKQSDLRKKSVHTLSKRKNKAQSRNDPFNAKSLTPKIKSIDLTNVDYDYNEILGIRNEVKDEQPDLSKKSVHTPKRIRTAQPRNDTFHMETVISNYIDLTNSDKEDEKLEMCNETKNEESPLSKKSVHTPESVKITQYKNDTSHVLPTTNTVDLTVLYDKHGVKLETVSECFTSYNNNEEEKSSDFSSRNSISNLIQNLWLANTKNTKEYIIKKYNIFRTVVYEHYEIYHSKIINEITNLLRENKLHLNFDKPYVKRKQKKLIQLFDSFIQMLDTCNKYKRIVFISVLIILFRTIVNTVEQTSSDVYCDFLKFTITIRKCKNEDFWISWLKTGWDDCFFGGCVIVDSILYNDTSCNLIYPAVNWFKMPSFETLFHTNYYNEQMCSIVQNECNTDNDLLELFSNAPLNFGVFNSLKIIVPQDTEISSIECDENKESHILSSNSSTVNVNSDTNKTAEVPIQEVEEITSSHPTVLQLHAQESMHSGKISDTNNMEVPVQESEKNISSHRTIQQLHAQAPKYSKKVETKKVASFCPYEKRFGVWKHQKTSTPINKRKNVENETLLNCKRIALEKTNADYPSCSNLNGHTKNTLSTTDNSVRHLHAQESQVDRPKKPDLHLCYSSDSE